MTFSLHMFIDFTLHRGKDLAKLASWEKCRCDFPTARHRFVGPYVPPIYGEEIYLAKVFKHGRVTIDQGLSIDKDKGTLAYIQHSRSTMTYLIVASIVLFEFIYVSVLLMTKYGRKEDSVAIDVISQDTRPKWHWVCKFSCTNGRQGVTFYEGLYNRGLVYQSGLSI